MNKIIIAVIAGCLIFAGCGSNGTKIIGSVSNVDDLKDTIIQKMKEIGISDEITIATIERSDMSFVNADCETEKEKFHVACSGSGTDSDPWEVFSISDAETWKYYYSDSEFQDVYDYETGELVQERVLIKDIVSSPDMIETAIQMHVEESYKDTVIDRINVNNGIALVYLKWNTKNSEGATKKMLRMYSDDLAATIADKYDELTEIAVFWNVSYLSKDYKWHYNCNNGKAIMDDSME